MGCRLHSCSAFSGTTGSGSRFVRGLPYRAFVSETPEDSRQPPEVLIRHEDAGGVWANFAAVSHSPYEFTIDFVRLDFSTTPPRGVVVSRVNLSPLFVSQLMDALKENWSKYAEKALPKEVRGDHEGG